MIKNNEILDITPQSIGEEITIIPDGDILNLEDLGVEILEIPIEIEPGITLIGRGPSVEQIQNNTIFNLNAADTTNANELKLGGSLNLNLDGSGITVGVWDGGSIRNTHQEFVINGGISRVELRDAEIGFSAHATHVAGTIGADGDNPILEGLANGVEILSFDFNNDLNELREEAESGLILSNHSYGIVTGWTLFDTDSDGFVDSDLWFEDIDLFTEDRDFGKYNLLSRDLDEILFDNPNLLSVWAASNDRNEGFRNRFRDQTYVTFSSTLGGWVRFDSVVREAPEGDGNLGSGFDSLPSAQVAKNNLVVGAINDISNDPFDSTDITIASFSSFGPTDDGRIKPDVVANGINLVSTESLSDTDFGTKSGTSMAAPNVTGVAALLYEHYDNLFDTTPRSATMKGLLIHTASDAGNIGPDYSFGWGLVDAEAGANFLSEANLLNDFNEQITQRDSLILEDTYLEAPLNLNFQFIDNNEPIKVTLVWTDPAGTPHGNGLDETTSVLVNDLDLSITGPDGNIFHPWTLDWNNPAAPAVRNQRNQLDNVEQVLIDADLVQDGEYTITINNTGALYNQRQDFSLLISGNVDEILESPVNNRLETDIYRFQNSDVPGTYIFAGAEESENIRANFPNFIEEGVAFKVAVEPGDDLFAFYRFQNSNVPGTYLFVGEEERNAINSDPNLSESFTEEGLAFYVYGAGAELGTPFTRFQNNDVPGTYLFAGPDESADIRNNSPNFVEEGIAFEAEIG